MPDAVQLAGFLGCLFFLVAGVNQIMRLVDRTKESPPPAQTYVTKETCAQSHSGRDELVREIRKDVDDLKRYRDQHRDQVEAAVERLRREMSDSMGRVHQRIDDLPALIITTMKNSRELLQ